MGQHQPRCPPWPARDHLAGRIVADQPGRAGAYPATASSSSIMAANCFPMAALSPPIAVVCPPGGHRRLSLSDEPDAIGESQAGPWRTEPTSASSPGCGSQQPPPRSHACLPQPVGQTGSAGGAGPGDTDLLVADGLGPDCCVFLSSRGLATC